MGAHRNDKWGEVDEDDGAGRIRVEETEIDTGEFEPEEQPHHEPVEEHDAPVKELLTRCETIDDSTDRCDCGTERRGKDRRDPLVRDLDDRVIEPPQEGEYRDHDNGIGRQLRTGLLNHRASLFHVGSFVWVCLGSASKNRVILAEK